MTPVETRLIEYVDGILKYREQGQAVSPDYCLDRLIDSHKNQGNFAKGIQKQLDAANAVKTAYKNMVIELEKITLGVRKTEKLSKWRRILIKWLSRGNINLGA